MLKVAGRTRKDGDVNKVFRARRAILLHQDFQTAPERRETFEIKKLYGRRINESLIGTELQTTAG